MQIGGGLHPASAAVCRPTDDADRLLDGLTEEQRHIVLLDAPVVAVLAGPGSGKTRVLTTRVAHRIATGYADPARTTVVTFTRRAAAELRSRLGTAGLRGPAAPTATTLHALAASTLQQVWVARGERPWGTGAYPLRILAPIVQALGSTDERGSLRLPGPRAVAAEIAWAKSRAIGADTYAMGSARARRLEGWGDDARQLVAEVYSAYELEKAKRHVLDVDDLIPALAARLADDRQLADALQWTHRHLFVDEFQDLGRAAFRLVRALVPDDVSDADLFVVGDPDQAVYGFAGSDPRLLRRLPDAMPGAQMVTMRRTHRCPTGAVAAARAVRDAQLPDAASVTADAPRATVRPSVTATPFDLGADEAGAVAWSLRAAHAEGRSWSRLAVLARTNARLDEVAAVCERDGIPVRDRRNLLDRPTVKTALDVLQLRPPEVRAPIVRSVLKEIAAEALGNPELGVGARRSLHALVSLAEEYATVTPAGTLDGFLAWLDGTVRARGGEPMEAGDAVDLLTFHRAKGLEWDHVHLIGVEARLVPMGRNLHPAEEDEERRLLYVALTRARETTSCTYVGDASPWLADAVAASAGHVEVPVGPTAEIRAIRAALAPRRDPLADRLRTWRAARARAAGLAPSTVLPDAALSAVLRFRPRTIADLALVPGFGRARAEAYGAALIEVLAA